MCYSQLVSLIRKNQGCLSWSQALRSQRRCFKMVDWKMLVVFPKLVRGAGVAGVRGKSMMYP